MFDINLRCNVLILNLYQKNFVTHILGKWHSKQLSKSPLRNTKKQALVGKKKDGKMQSYKITNIKHIS